MEWCGCQTITELPDRRVDRGVTVFAESKYADNDILLNILPECMCTPKETDTDSVSFQEKSALKILKILPMIFIIYLQNYQFRILTTEGSAFNP